VVRAATASGQNIVKGNALVSAGRLGSLGLAVLLAGCHAAPPTAPPQPSLLAVPRGTTKLDLSAVPAPDPAYRVALPADRRYRALSAEECRCLAVQNANLAELLDTAAEQGPASDCFACLPGKSKARLIEQVQSSAAGEARNRAAGLALEAYYRLAEAEGRVELLSEGQVEVDSLLVHAEEMYAKKLLDHTAVDAARRERDDLRADAVRLRLAIDQLNEQLKTLLALSTCDDESLWPTSPLRPEPLEKCVEEYVALGLAQRDDLTLLRTVLAELNARTLPVVRQLLGSVNPLLAMSTGPLAKLLLALKDCLCHDEVETARRQVETLLREREREAASEIRQAVRETESRLWLVGAARQRVTEAERTIVEMQEKHGRNLASSVEVSRARLAVLKERRDLLSETVNWEVAHSQLRRSLGVLAHERCAETGAGKEDGNKDRRCSPSY
jgi:hypothetical protein